ncbi:Uncharacterised protein [Shigella flexneri]|nr:Uncharacterised protein [Shigella flexneri]
MCQPQGILPDFTATTQGRRSVARFLLGKQFFNSRNAFHFNWNSRQTALKSGISWVTFQLILKQQPRPVIMTKMTIGFRKV